VGYLCVLTGGESRDELTSERGKEQHQKHTNNNMEPTDDVTTCTSVLITLLTDLYSGPTAGQIEITPRQCMRIKVRFFHSKLFSR